MYKVGDKVKIREDLVVDKVYDVTCSFAPTMSRFCGKTVTIKKIHDLKERYKIEEDDGVWWYSPSMIDDKFSEGSKGEDMKDFKIVNYKKYEDKVVIVEFEDETEEKAVCNEDDKFDFERGVEVCVLKHIYGKEGYKKMLKTAMDQIDAVDKAKEEKEKNDEIAARKKAKNAARKARHHENRRKARIEEMTEAYMNAMKLYGTTDVKHLVDELK